MSATSKQLPDILVHHTGYLDSINIKLWFDSTKFRFLFLRKLALQKIPPLVLATIKSTFRQNHVPPMNINRRTMYTCLCSNITYNYRFPLVSLLQLCSVQTWVDTYSTNFRPIVINLIQTRDPMQYSSYSHTSGTA